MTNAKTILVIGATGAQGGGVVRHLLKSGKFNVRALTRNPDSDKARALAQTGAEIVRGDLSDPDSLRTAMQGCYGVFGVTNFWEHFEKEYDHGKNLIDAVKDTAIEHFVFSSLPYAHKLSEWKLEVPHFDIKGKLEDYARSLKVPSTFAHVAFYYENFLYFFPPKPQEDRSYIFGFPQGETPLAAVCVEDVGGVVATIFERPDELRDKTVGIVGDDLPCSKYAEIMSRVLGKKIVYRYIPRDVFAKLGFAGAQDLANMFEYNRLFIPNRKADLEQSLALYPGMQRFEPWVQANKDKFAAILK
ncbi:MAG TPA: NmrA/HSCARG family protein [Terriglobia bacterium]|nr:NmrA/HSCARG family protein [Terriglobia bacterium]